MLETNELPQDRVSIVGSSLVLSGKDQLESSPAITNVLYFESQILT